MAVHQVLNLSGVGSNPTTLTKCNTQIKGFTLKNTILLDDGNLFTGLFDKDGIRNGKGIKVYTNGATYKGVWINDKRHGEGIKTWADGTTKTVEYRAGVLIK